MYTRTCVCLCTWKVMAAIQISEKMSFEAPTITWRQNILFQRKFGEVENNGPSAENAT